MIEPLLALISREMDLEDGLDVYDVDDVILEHALTSAERGHLSILRLLLAYLDKEHFEREDDGLQLVSAAITSTRNDILEFALSRVRGLSPMQMHKLAIDQDSTMLLERKPDLTRRQTRELFKYAAEKGAMQCIQLFLSWMRRQAGHDGNISKTMLGFILVELPSSMELLDWAIELGDTRLQKASESAIRGEIDRNGDMPIQALFLAMLYPSLRLSDLLFRMESVGVDYETCVLAGQLVCAHLGESFEDR